MTAVLYLQVSVLSKGTAILFVVSDEQLHSRKEKVTCFACRTSCLVASRIARSARVSFDYETEHQRFHDFEQNCTILEPQVDL